MKTTALAAGKRAGIVVRLGPVKRRSRAGVAMASRQASSSSDPRSLIDWLSDCYDAGLTITAPVEIEAKQDSWHMTVILWSLETSARETILNEASKTDLDWLAGNLAWLERQRANSRPLLDLLSLLLDAETVDLRRISLRARNLVVSGLACDSGSMKHFSALLQKRASRLAHPPAIDIERLKVPTAVTAGTGTGIDMQDLDPLSAVLSVAGLGHANVIVAGTAGSAGAPLSGHMDGADVDGLLTALFERMRLVHRKVGAVTVAAAKLSREPPAAAMFSDRAIDVFFPDASPAEVLSLLADVSRVGLLPPRSQNRLALAVRGQVARTLASLILWALDLTPRGDRTLAVVLPADAPALDKDQGEAVSLWAGEAPLGEIVAELAGIERLTDCSPQTSGLSAHLKDVPRKRLLSGLLASRGLGLSRHGSLATIESPSGKYDSSACRKTGRCGTGDTRLYAIMQRSGHYRALLSDAGRSRWFSEGDRLSDGRLVRRIRAGRVLLKKETGSNETLAPALAMPEGCGPRGCERKKAATDFPLARLRLAGTVRLGKRRAALLADPHGNVHLVREGGLLGRRCGSISRVLPGSIEVTLGCPTAVDPPRAKLSLSAVSRKTPQP
ncbi:MAG TPA: pilus assembly protein PilP [Myxococcota bacterium]|nr:pilus assembly protein PilP [Myxococcota bacterium]